MQRISRKRPRSVLPFIIGRHQGPVSCLRTYREEVVRGQAVSSDQAGNELIYIFLPRSRRVVNGCRSIIKENDAYIKDALKRNHKAHEGDFL